MCHRETRSPVVRPTTAQQVGAALRFAAAEGIGVGIRCGGHGSGHFANDGGLVIELSNFTGIEVDGTTVRIGGGATWGEVAVELGRHRLALSSGDTKSAAVEHYLAKLRALTLAALP
jgi:FAD/FMN-containing dehydrogenase